LQATLFLLLGLAFLINGAHLLVGGATAIAARARVPSMVVGLTIVSFGTSMPEFLVTMISGLQHNADLAVANVIGSNIANVLLVLGLAAVIRPLPIGNATVVSEVPFSLTAALLVGFLANAALFSPYPELSISRLDGVILLFFFLLFMMYVYKMSQEGHGRVEPPREGSSSTPRAVATVLLSVVLLYFGGTWVVDGALALAADLGVDDALVGLTVVAVGTSMPEVVASAVAAYRNEADLAVGNVVGSNIFNLLWVLGSTSAVVELPFEVISNTDLVMVIAASALVILALVSSRHRMILRYHGVLFILLYAAYIVYAIRRG
jgi:cation:H+ antiporter